MDTLTLYGLEYFSFFFAFIGIIMGLGTLYEYVEAWTRNAKVQEPWFSRIGLFKWNNSWHDGSTAFFGHFVLTIVLFISGLIWFISIPVFMLIGIAFYVRHVRTKEG